MINSLLAAGIIAASGTPAFTTSMNSNRIWINNDSGMSPSPSYTFKGISINFNSAETKIIPTLKIKFFDNIIKPFYKDAKLITLEYRRTSVYTYDLAKFLNSNDDITNEITIADAFKNHSETKLKVYIGYEFWLGGELTSLIGYIVVTALVNW